MMKRIFFMLLTLTAITAGAQDLRLPVTFTTGRITMILFSEPDAASPDIFTKNEVRISDSTIEEISPNREKPILHRDVEKISQTVDADGYTVALFKTKVAEYEHPDTIILLHKVENGTDIYILKVPLSEVKTGDVFGFSIIEN